MLTRRLLLAALVLTCLALVLTGCASPAIQCGMKDNYQQPTKATVAGTGVLRWKFNATGCKSGSYGCELPREDGAMLLLKFPPPDPNDICALAKLGHEVAHYMGASHEE